MTTMVNNPLIRLRCCWGKGGVGGGLPLDFHDDVMMVHGCEYIISS